MALAGLDGGLAEGEFVSLVGPSGCGKSTVLRLIAGLEKPTRGRVACNWPVDGRRAAPPVSCVFQEPTLLPWARVWDNVYLPLRLQNNARKASATLVAEAIERVGLSGFEGAYSRELSGGMKMRVSIARALVTRPKVLLLDEPFAALDEITRFKLNDDLLSLWAEHRWTVVFVTHSVYESVFLSTRVMVMTPRPGRVVDDVAIDLPSPRTAATRSLPAYHALCDRVSSSLASATGATTAG